MKTKYLIAGVLSALFLFTGCDSKSEIDEGFKRLANALDKIKQD